MSNPPFSMSEDAAAFLLEILQCGDTDPRLSGFVLVLCAYTRDALLGSDGQVLEQYSGLPFDFGWYDDESVAALGYPEIELLGRMVRIEPSTLSMLEGNRLVVETAGVDHPGVPTTKRRRLTCQSDDLPR